MEVADYTALLGYLEQDAYRWNAITSLGTQAVVTYSFYEPETLPAVSGSGVGQTNYWSFDEAQRESFRSALAEFEAASGLVFIEVEGPAMINAFGYDMYSSTSGWAYYPYSTTYSTSSGDLAIGSGDFSVGGNRYDTILHEIGHAVGLQHPHDGELTLSAGVDTRNNTVMTYTAGTGTELGVFDVQALQHIYGSADSFDGWQVSGGGTGAVQIRATGNAETILATDVDTIIWARGGSDAILGREGDDALYGGSGHDTITGGYGDDTILGGWGHDLIIGGLDETDYSGEAREDDFLSGFRGNDTIFGGNGNDTLRGGGGVDSLNGGAGDDRLAGHSGSDVLIGGAGADVLIGGAGYDTLDGGYGDDLLSGRNGNDNLEGGAGEDTLYGGAGFDTLEGGSGDDLLVGHRGNDQLTGGDGNDTMTGGYGADVFIFNDDDFYDTNTITDFTSGVDLIDLTAIDPDFIGTLQVSTTETGTTLSYSYWFEIELLGFTGSLGADDILYN